jgi:hypothetical protein
MQLELWGLDFFDLFLVHFPISLAYVDPKHRYPPEWWGDDGKSVSLRAYQLSCFPFFCFPRGVALICVIRKYAVSGDMGRYGRTGRRGTRKKHWCQVSTETHFERFADLIV